MLFHRFAVHVLLLLLVLGTVEVVIIVGAISVTAGCRCRSVNGEKGNYFSFQVPIMVHLPVVRVHIVVLVVIVCRFRLYILQQFVVGGRGPIAAVATIVQSQVERLGRRCRLNHVLQGVGSVPFFLAHLLFILLHQFPLGVVLLVLLIVQHLLARVHLLHATQFHAKIVIIIIIVIVVDDIQI
jgi:hypothetical protein